MKRAIGLVVAVGTLALAGSANAAKVGIGFYDGDIGVAGGYIPEYIADPGEVNAPAISFTSAGAKIITFHDPIATISADPPGEDSPCMLLDSHTAECVLPDPRWIQQKSRSQSLAALYATSGSLLYVRADLGDRNDSYAGLAGEPFSLDLYGGAGNDTLFTGPGLTGIHADAGNDFIYAADGRDTTVFCGDGTDHVRTRDAGDTLWSDCEEVAAP
jgi:Ca2+-binding RTX toxin-like protein